VRRLAGADTCLVRVPAQHVLPNSNRRARPDGTPDAVLGASSGGGLAWFGMPRLDDVLEWVYEAGISAHRASEFWQDRIRPWCRGRDGLRDRFCNPDRSASFRGELATLDSGLN
jgi:hypothetical protein